MSVWLATENTKESFWGDRECSGTRLSESKHSHLSECGEKIC